MKTISKKIKIIVEKTDTGFSAFSENYPFYSTGSTVPELIANTLEAANLYFEKIVLKKGSFTGYFIANRESPFYQSPLFEKILRFLQQNHPHVQLKENNKKLLLTIRKIPTIKAAMHWLNKIEIDE